MLNITRALSSVRKSLTARMHTTINRIALNRACGSSQFILLTIQEVPSNNAG